MVQFIRITFLFLSVLLVSVSLIDAKPKPHINEKEVVGKYRQIRIDSTFFWEKVRNLDTNETGIEFKSNGDFYSRRIQSFWCNYGPFSEHVEVFNGSWFLLNDSTIQIPGYSFGIYDEQEIYFHKIGRNRYTFSSKAPKIKIMGNEFSFPVK